MSGASDATGFWVLPRPVNAEFLDYVLTSKGDPYWASDRFGRMLYLSATTITTLGLGDITPISSEARLLIGIEALLGIVLIGLFLNDLANRLRSVT
ncbi:MAG: potassium channel family protein [Solirubrobacteraceae bacterium]